MRTNGLVSAIIIVLIKFEGIRSDNLTGYKGEVLNFWSPEPKFYTRQTNNKLIDRNHHIQPVNINRNDIRNRNDNERSEHNRGKVNKQENRNENISNNQFNRGQPNKSLNNNKNNIFYHDLRREQPFEPEYDDDPPIRPVNDNNNRRRTKNSLTFDKTYNEFQSDQQMVSETHNENYPNYRDQKVPTDDDRDYRRYPIQPVHKIKNNQHHPDNTPDQPLAENKINQNNYGNRIQAKPRNYKNDGINKNENDRYHHGYSTQSITDKQKTRYSINQKTKSIHRKERKSYIHGQRIRENPHIDQNLTYPESEELTFRKQRNVNKKMLRSTQGFTDLRSTRMTPMALMQQEDEPTKHKDKQEDSESFRLLTKRVYINPYSVEEKFKELLSDFPEVDVSSEILGRTASYNNIYLFKISKDNRTSYFRAHEGRYVEEKPEKKIIFIVHALSPMGLPRFLSLTANDFLHVLLSFYVAHLDKFDLYLIPLANPDGFMKAHHYPYWNKNVSPQSECPGVNVDRNFDVAWNASLDISSCHPYYPGPSAFSEAESSAVRDILHRLSNKIIAYFHVHAGTYDSETFKGDAVLYPKGFTDVQTDDDKYIDLKGEIDEAMKNANFKVLSVTVDTLYNWYGKVSGTSVDYAATVYGIPYAMELVMQVYEDLEKKVNDYGNVNILKEYYALTEIWGRVIDVIFTNIWNNMYQSDGRRG